MAGNIAPNIVFDNLVLCLDTANTKSYPGIGSQWSDLSRYGYLGTLYNSPTFDTNNLGSLVFDGLNTYGAIPYNSNFDLSSTDYTLEGWFNSNTFSSGFALISKDTYGVNFDWALYVPDSTTLLFYSNGTSTNVTATVPTMSTGQWYQYVVTSISGNITIYLNGIEYGSGTMSTSNNSLFFITLGCYSWNNPGGFTNGKISILRVYSKGLTNKEVIQNYNSVKSRYIF